jgi:glycerol-3-phosphate acyltransferase PlsY
MAEFFWILASWLLGSVPFGLVFARCAQGLDPRLSGSGNIGATTVARLCGFGWGVCTLACDLGKGAVASCGALYINPDAVFVSLAAFAAVAGHRWSCFTGFQGGKAVATSIGVFLPLAFWQTFAAAFLCVACILRSGFVSAGSLVLVASLPLFLLLTGTWRFVPLAAIIAAVVIRAHGANILRLLRGEEKSWRKSKNF